MPGITMRTPIAVLLLIVMVPAVTSNPDRSRLPSIAVDTIALGEVRRGSAVAVSDFRDRDSLVVERPIGASERATSSVFVVDEDGTQLRRVVVTYGRVAGSLIQIASGVLPGDRIVVSDMRAWDAFDRLRLRSR
jgi:multidrug efflux pump subunit AcrA (membrane-fusion protein)